MSNGSGQILTLTEVCEALRVSKATLFVHILPTLPSFTIGRRRLVRRSDLDAWIAGRVGVPDK